MSKSAAIEYWAVVENPADDVYQNLLKALIQHSDKFYFVTRKELSYNEAILESFTPYVIKKYQTKDWASTRTKGPAATVYEIVANEETYRMLVAYASSLYDWLAPNLPEDLTFIKNDFVWFFSSSHEAFATFAIRLDYYREIMLRIEGLQVKKIDE